MVGVRGYVGPQFFDFVYTVYIIRLVVKQKIEIPEKNQKSGKIRRQENGRKYVEGHCKS